LDENYRKIVLLELSTIVTTVTKFAIKATFESEISFNMCTGGINACDRDVAAAAAQ